MVLSAGFGRKAFRPEYTMVDKLHHTERMLTPMALHIKNPKIEGGGRGRDLMRFLEEEAWPVVSADVLGKPLTREEEEEEILGFGDGGA